jgi:GDPmannose 4,6-dehydratase
MKKALITGVLGQDGSHLAELLADKGYIVHGTARKQSVFCEYWPLPCHVHYADMRDELALETVIRKIMPDEIYNLAAQPFVPTSWTQPEETFDVNVGGLARVLKIVEKIKPDTRVYQASSSEMFGNRILESADDMPLHEGSKMRPVSPYGVSKLAAHHLVDVYRQKGLFVVSGILFNHEGPRRGEEMVTRKIAIAVAHWALGEKYALRLGNMQARRDWGFAGDYVRAMHMMLQRDVPNDYVVGMGASHSVEEFLYFALTVAQVDASVMIEQTVVADAAHVRQNELHCLVADAGKIRQVLGLEAGVRF